MGTVRTIARGYIGSILREVGEVFEWPEGHEIAPWVRPVEDKPVVTAHPSLVVPDDWKSEAAGDRIALASLLTNKDVATAKEADQIIGAFALVQQHQPPAPFDDAPEPETVVGNGVVAELGGPAPDWLAPGPDSTPKPVAD